MKAINTKLDKIMSVITIYDERVTRYENDMTELKDSVSELRVCVNKKSDIMNDALTKINKQYTPDDKIKYADCVKQNDPVILVVPKRDQAAQVTQKEVMELMDPTEIPVENIRNAAKGTVVLEGRNKEDLDIIHRYATEKLGTTYEVKFSEMRKPKIIVSGMCEKITKEEIVTKIKRQNSSMENAELKVVSIFGKNNFSSVIEMDSDSFNKLMTSERKKLNIGWSSCVVKEHIDVLTCYKCQGFHHKATNCTQQRACKKCAGEHDVRECKSNAIKCINCSKANQRLNLNLTTNHIAGSDSCIVMQRKVNASKKRVQYNANK